MIECRGVFLPDGEDHLVMMINRMPMVDRRGAYQFAKYQRALAYIKQKRNAIDIGSHVGLWTMHLVKDFTGTIHCFEPMASHRECFDANMAADRNPKQKARVALYPVALGPTEGEISLQVYPGNSGHTHVAENGQAGVAVAMRTLDSYDLRDIGFIKIDCEGYERYVLEGAVETLVRERPVIVVEQKKDMGSRYGIDDQSAVHFLEGLGAKLITQMNGDYFLHWRD